MTHLLNIAVCNFVLPNDITRIVDEEKLNQLKT